MEVQMREHRAIERVLVLVFLYGVIGGIWCHTTLCVHLGMMSALRHQGATINRPWFFVGTGLASLSAAAGMLAGQLTRRRKPLWAAVIAGIAGLLTFLMVGCGLLALSVRFP